MCEADRAKLGSNPESRLVHCNSSMIYNLLKIISFAYMDIFLYKHFSSLYDIKPLEKKIFGTHVVKSCH